MYIMVISCNELVECFAELKNYYYYLKKSYKWEHKYDSVSISKLLYKWIKDSSLIIFKNF